MRLYLQKQSEEVEGRSRQEDSEGDVLIELKGFIEEKLHSLGSDWKDLKQEFINLNFRLTKIEGKLEGLEKIIEQTQGQEEIRLAKQKIEINGGEGGKKWKKQ